MWRKHTLMIICVSVVCGSCVFCIKKNNFKSDVFEVCASNSRKINSKECTIYSNATLEDVMHFLYTNIDEKRIEWSDQPPVSIGDNQVLASLESHQSLFGEKKASGTILFLEFKDLGFIRGYIFDDTQNEVYGAKIYEIQNGKLQFDQSGNLVTFEGKVCDWFPQNYYILMCNLDLTIQTDNNIKYLHFCNPFKVRTRAYCKLNDKLFGLTVKEILNSTIITKEGYTFAAEKEIVGPFEKTIQHFDLINKEYEINGSVNLALCNKINLKNKE